MSGEMSEVVGLPPGRIRRWFVNRVCSSSSMQRDLAANMPCGDIWRTPLLGGRALACGMPIDHKGPCRENKRSSGGWKGKNYDPHTRAYDYHLGRRDLSITFETEETETERRVTMRIENALET